MRSLIVPTARVDTGDTALPENTDSVRRALLTAAVAVGVTAIASSAEARGRHHGGSHNSGHHESARRGHGHQAPHAPRAVHARPHRAHQPHVLRGHGLYRHGQNAEASHAAPEVIRPNINRVSHFVRTPAPTHAGERRLSLYVAASGERASAVYWENGEYIPAGLREISYLLRDHRTDTAVGISPELLDYLNGVTRKVEYSRPVQVVSGYRSPRTNEMLRHHQDGVARNSYHTKGRAVDIVMPGIDLRHVRTAALNLSAGGVGYYPDSGFVHLDSGPRRTWMG